MVSSLSHRNFGALSQIMLAATCMATAALWPPAAGSLLAVPLGGGGATTINIAVANGARIENAGPFRGSIVLQGERARLAGPLWAHHVLLVAGASWMCRS